MNRKFYTFNSEPNEKTYEYLIDYAVEKNKCKFVFLIVRNNTTLNKSGLYALKLLTPYLETIQEVSEWPGTKLYEHTAKLYKYKFRVGLTERIKELSTGFYDWVHPDLPEDLSLMVTEELPWLFTIAHEKDAVLCLTEDEENELLINKDLALILKKDNYYHEK